MWATKKGEAIPVALDQMVQMDKMVRTV